MSRIRFCCVVVGMLLLAGLAGGLSAHLVRRASTRAVSGEASSLRISLDFFPNPNHIPLYVAQELGYFASEGLEVEVFVPANPSDPVKLAAAKAVDLALTPQINYLIARGEGLPLICVGALIGHPLGGLLALADTEVPTLDRLAGRTIGYSLAPLEPVLWGTVLDCVGVDPSSVKWVNVGYGAMAALIAGHVNAIGAFRNYERLQLEELGYDAVFFPQEVYCVPTTWELVLVSHPALVEERGEAASAFVRALERGIEWTVSNPGEAARIFFSRFPDLDDALNRRSFEETRSLYARGSVGDERIWEDLQRYLVEHELMAREFPVGELYVIHPESCP